MRSGGRCGRGTCRSLVVFVVLWLGGCGAVDRSASRSFPGPTISAPTTLPPGAPLIPPPDDPALTKLSDPGDAAAQAKQWRVAASLYHGAMVRSKFKKKYCRILKNRRNRAVDHYAAGVLAGLETSLSTTTVSTTIASTAIVTAVFGQAAGLARAKWIAAAERHRAEALMVRAGAALWSASAQGAKSTDFAARLRRVQQAAAWVTQLTGGDPTAQAWRAESLVLAKLHAALRAARSRHPFAAWVQHKLTRELGGADAPRSSRWLAAVISGSSLRFHGVATGAHLPLARLPLACRPLAQRVLAALASPLGLPVEIDLTLEACGDRKAHRVLIGRAQLRFDGGRRVAVPLNLGASLLDQPSRSTNFTAKQLSRLDQQLVAAAADRIRAAAAPLRLAKAEALHTRAVNLRGRPLQAEELWLQALAWTGTLPPAGAAFLLKNLGLSVKQARAAQSTRWLRPRLLLRLPRRPYPAGPPIPCFDSSDFDD